MKVRDGQRDFSGGMVDRVAPERLGENQYAYGKNVEIRYGGVRSRRGSWRVRLPIKDTSGNVTTTTGFTVHRSANTETPEKFVWASLEDSDTKTYLRRSPAIGTTSYTAKMVTPETINGKQGFRFVNGYDTLFAMRDGARPWKWSGEESDPWEYVADGISGEPPTARDGLYAYNRLWLIEGDDTVIPSDLLEENWDRVDNEFRVEQGDGTRLVALRQFGGGSLLAFKERGVALIRSAFNFADAGDLNIEFISSTIGALAADTVVNIGNDVFFLGREGVWTIRQTTEQNAQLVEVPLSEPIYGLMQDVNWTYADTCSAVQFDNYYILAVPTGSATVPNRLLAYDLLLKSWVGFWEFDDGAGDPYKFSRILTATIASREYLIAIGIDGTVNYLLNGDYKDFEQSEMVAAKYVYAEIPASMRTEFTDGWFEVAFYQDFWLAGTSIKFVVGTWGLSIANPDNKTYTFNLMRGSAPTTTVDVSAVDFPLIGGIQRVTYHHRQDTVNGDTFTIFINGAKAAEVTGDPILVDGWFASTDPLWIGGGTAFAANNVPVLYYDLFTERKSSSSAANPHRIFFPCNNGAATNQVIVYYGANSTSEEVTIANYSQSITWTTIATDPAVDIDSVLKTRGMSFGDLFAVKSGLRGELRFSHGQPSVTCEMGSDIPFDEETFASLSAKTYSLTDYEVVGRSAWDATNANNDFQTPFREDYAPIALGVQMGAAGLVLDKHREHTELFSTLAIFGWAQFTLTNTQGFIRYNGLSLTAQDRNYEQDTGNNGN